MTLKLLMKKLIDTYTANCSFSTGHARWGWCPPQFFLYPTILNPRFSYKFLAL